MKMHIVTNRNAAIYERELDEFFKLRHAGFAEERGWVPRSEDGRERDQFDTDAATYVLGMDRDNLVGTSRLMATTEPNLVSEVFPHLCEVEGVPRRPDWADWTRVTVAPDYRGGKHAGVSGLLAVAVMEYCLEEGIEWVGGVQEFYLMGRWAELGWKVKPMGLPRRFGDQEYIVAYVKCTEEALERARRLAGVEGSLLVRRGEQRPFIDHLWQERAQP